MKAGVLSISRFMCIPIRNKVTTVITIDKREMQPGRLLSLHLIPAAEVSLMKAPSQVSKLSQYGVGYAVGACMILFL